MGGTIGPDRGYLSTLFSTTRCVKKEPPQVVVLISLPAEERGMSRIVRCGLIQAANVKPPSEPMESVKAAMIEKHVGMIEEAGKRGVQIRCLQERFCGRHFC